MLFKHMRVYTEVTGLAA